MTTEPRSPDTLDDVSDVTFSRRGLGKRLLLGASALAVLIAAEKSDTIQAAPLTDTWKLGGNSGVLANGTNFLGTTNIAPLIFKTAAVANTPLERMRITPTGNIGIGITTPVAKLQVYSTTFAVYARHTATSGSQPGVYGETLATVASASGVQGVVRSAAPGVDSAGVLGQNSGTNSNGAGLRGSHAGGGFGVQGISANGNGVQGETRSASSIGVNGLAPNSISTALSAVGVRGQATVGVMGSGEYMGVQGSSLNYAVFGYTTPDTAGIGVYGRGGTGVKGRSYTGFAVLGDTDSGTGVRGESYGNGGAVAAISGQGYGASNNGVIGRADNGTAAYGVWGISSTGYAGVFSGKALVTGTLSKGGGSFKIDHPLAPDTKYLYHSFVESPDMMNVYNGNVTTDAKGDATVQMPEWFETLNRDFRYQLTVIGQFAQAIIADKIKENTFTIKTDKPNVEVSWLVTGIRQDAFANANRIPVEEDKPFDERGTYLHPKEHGKPESAGVNAERIKKLHENKPKREREPQDPQPNQ